MVSEYVRTCIYSMAGNISEGLFDLCDLVRFRYAAVGNRRNSFETEMIISIII